MTGFVIDFDAGRRAIEAERNRDQALRALQAMCRCAVGHIVAGFPGAEEANAIMEKAFAEDLPEELTEASILRQAKGTDQ